MQVPARLKWRKEAGRFAAYPAGPEHTKRYVEVRLYNSGINTDQVPHVRFESWLWLVKWEGWFLETGFRESKQEAADAATAAWWRLVDTEIPRDIDLEVAMIVARLLIRPAPNSLFDEEPDYLRKVLSYITTVYAEELKADTMPASVRNLMEQVSSELARRRSTGQIVDPPKEVGAVSGGYKRRRRR